MKAKDDSKNHSSSIRGSKHTPAPLSVTNLDLQTAASQNDDAGKVKNSMMVSEMDVQQISMGENGQSFDKDMGDISQAVCLEFALGANHEHFTLLNKNKVNPAI